MANELPNYLKNGDANAPAEHSNSSVIARYCSGEDAEWIEEKHHRADNGRFTSGSGRGKRKDSDKEGSASRSDTRNGEGRKGEVEQEVAERAVREAFEKTGGGLDSMKMVGHHLSVKTTVKKEKLGEKVDAINGHLKDHGLKARVDGGTTLHVAEDAGGENAGGVPGDRMARILVLLCAVGMLSKDLHYRAKGKSFYGMHELADISWRVERHFDDLNETYYMGEKRTNPSNRASIATEAAKEAGMHEDEDSLIAALSEKLGDLAAAVEDVKGDGVYSGTGAILDEISKDALQSRGLIDRVQLGDQPAGVAGQAANESPRSVDTSAIDKVISKGLVISGEAEKAQDSGTSEGAKKGWDKRRIGSSGMLGRAYMLATGKRREIAGESRGRQMLKNMGHSIESAAEALKDESSVERANQAYREHMAASENAFKKEHGFV